MTNSKKAESPAKLELKRLTVRSPADVSLQAGLPTNQFPGVSLTCFCPTRPTR